MAIIHLAGMPTTARESENLFFRKNAASAAPAASGLSNEKSDGRWNVATRRTTRLPPLTVSSAHDSERSPSEIPR